MIIKFEKGSDAVEPAYIYNLSQVWLGSNFGGKA